MGTPRTMSGGPMSRLDGLTLYEQFERARIVAVASTDEFHDLSADDPQRLAVWARVMDQTEMARQYLEAWLHAEDCDAEDDMRILSRA